MTKYPVLLTRSGSAAPVADRIIYPESGSMTLSKVPLSTATLTLKAEEVLPVRSLVAMYSPFGYEGVYRVRTSSGGYGGEASSSVELEHAVTELGDYLVTTDAEQTTTLAQGLNKLFTDNYRGNLWQLGSLTATDSVLLSTAHNSLLEAMNDLMEQAPDYLFTFDFSTFPWTLGIAKRDLTTTAEGRISRNVTEATVTYDDTDLCTRVIVEYTTAGGKTTSYLTINADTIGTYGVVEKHLAGGYSQSEAQIVGDAYIAAHKRPTVAVDITGKDLSAVTGEALDTFRPGKLFRLALPDYGVTVEQDITAVEWDDLYGNPESVNISLADVEDPVIRFMKKQNKGIRGTSNTVKKQNKEYWTKFTQTDTQIELVAGHSDYNGDILRLAGLSIDEYGVLQYAEDHSDPNSKYLGSKFYVQAQAISAEVTRATGAEGILSGRIAVTADAVEAEVTRATGEEGRLSGRITVNANKVGLVVEQKDGQDVIKTASIIAAINDDSTSEIHIDADNIYIGNATSTTVINGKCSLSDVTADYISGKIATLSVVNVNSLNSAGNIVAGSAGYVMAPVYYLGTAGNARDMASSIWALRLTQSGDTYTLQKLDYDDSDWVDVGSFNRAASAVVTLSGNWSGTTYTVTASGATAQAETTTIYQTIEGASTPNATIYAKVYKDNPNVAVNQLTSTEMVMTEDVINKKVILRTGSGASALTKGSISTADTYTAGYNGAKIAKGTWSNGQISFTKSQNTGSLSGSVQLVSSGPVWNDTIVSVAIWDGTAADAQHGTFTGYRVSIPVAGKLQSKSVSVSGTQTISPDSGYIGLSSVEVSADLSTARARFGSASETYYIEAYDNISGTAVYGSTVTYQLGTSGSTSSTKVQIQDGNGTRISNTPEINVGSLYTEGKNDVKLAASWGTGDDANKLTVSKSTTGSSGPLNYYITTDTAVVWDSAEGKFKATPHAYCDGEERKTGTTAYSGGITIQFNNLQGAGASAYRTVSVKNGSTAIVTSGNLTDYGDGYSEGNTDGKNAVTLAAPVWIGTNSNYYNTIRVSTSGRPTNLNSDTTLYITKGSWGNGSIPVYIRSGSTSGTVRATSSVSAPDASGFDTTNADTSHSAGGYTNNSDGYQIISTGASGRAAIVVKGTWSAGGRGYTEYNYLEGAPTNLYRAAYSSGNSAGDTAGYNRAASESPTGFDTTTPSGESYAIPGLGVVTNNASGYYLSSSGANGVAYAVVKGTWTQSGHSKTGKNYLGGMPTALYRKGFADGVGSIDPPDDISINDPTWYDSTASLPSVDATLSTMGSIINSHKNGRGYVYFNVTIAGISGQKKYRIPIGSP